MSDDVMMPRTLTAANGAKLALIGEFGVKTKVECPVCGGCGMDEDDELGARQCYVCDGEGYVDQDIGIPWTTIKAIYAAAVEHFHPGEGE